ncbi:hypothetical protein Scep_029449 [Stephania cephalantha]|uniref:Protein LOW PSII ACCUMULATION 1, chloroplastic n=1 Tax=Stephania cephalantha TaxID=152367 RepID=A0AAP0HC83_9MAGN
MFFYLAFIASGSLGSLIASTQFISSLIKQNPSTDLGETLKSLAIDLAAVALFSFLYSREDSAKKAQLARLSREEGLGNLRGGGAAGGGGGAGEFVAEAFRRSREFAERLVERGVVVVGFATDGESVGFEFGEGEEKLRRLWQLGPVNVPDWAMWLDEQKKLANVPPESPVYISLRMDGRVRGSGVGYPPWNAFVAQLPPVKGLWSGLLDGMDGRVL